MSSTTVQSANERWLTGLLGGDFLLWSPNIQAEGYLHWEQIFATRKVPASDPIPLAEAPEQIEPVYEYGGQRRTVEDLMQVDHLSGLIVLKEGEIVLERYALGLQRETTWQSSSMVKSLASVLVGAAIHDGFIGSLDELVLDHLPELAVNPAYQDVTLRQVLQMSSGTAFSEEYDDHESDVMEHYLRPIAHRRPGVILEQRKVARRQYEPGEHFHYNTGDSFLLSLILSRAVGKTVADYCAERIWKPMGMETDGYFLLDSDDGDEVTGSCAGASLRDYARIGQLMADDGVAANGERVLPEGWVAESTAPSSPNFDYVIWNDVPGASFSGYGYMWWVLRPGVFMAVGFAGQWIVVVPDERLVFVMLAALPQGPYVSPDEPLGQTAGNYLGTLERVAFIDAVRAELT